MAGASETVGAASPSPTARPQGVGAEQRRASAAGRVRWLLGRPRLLIFGSIVAGMAVIGLLAPVLAPYDPIQTQPAQALQGPSIAHPLGTDNLGRDTLSRVIYGARISLTVAVIAVSIALVGGVSLGLIAGYFGGLADDILSRFIDALLAFPGILLAIAITAALGPTLVNAMIAVGIIGVPTYFRLTRGQVLQSRELDFVTAATVLGASRLRIVTRHILPNIVNPLIVAASIASSAAILSTASLSYIGIGAQPPQPD
ncbi:MAG: ABC transporter permease, partial [Chloroflexota bacterium]|nr:ABC transporter permease [Chloroflexota bacterium]